jgi:phosphohistidine phosphatase
MKKLLLIRHAEAVSFSEKGDIGRQLSQKGELDVADLANKLRDTGNVPQQLMSSPSVRTVSTSTILAQVLDLAAPLYLPAIYEASEKTLLKAINKFSDRYDFVAMVGHNPGIGYLILNLTEKVRDVPPCTAITIVFEDINSWQEVTHGSGLITYYTTPDHP